MKRFIISLFISSFLILETGQVLSQDFGKVHTLITEGITSIYNVDFNTALSKFQEAKKIAPGDLRGPFFESTVYFWRCMFTRNKNDYDTYLKLTDGLVDHCENVIDKNENDLDARFYLGWSSMMRAFIVYYIDRNILKGASEIKDGSNALQFVIEKNPNYYDAYLGLGFYNYIISLIPKKLQWLTSILGFNGDRAEGKRMLKIASERGIYTNYEAKFYLSIFAWREEDYTLAENYGTELKNSFPESPGVLILWGLLMQQQDKMTEAIKSFQKCLELNKTGEEIIFKYTYGALGSAYFRMNEYEKASEYGKKYMSYLTKDENKNGRLYAIGVSLELVGRRSEAIEYYKQLRSDFKEDNEWERYYFRKLNLLLNVPLNVIDSFLIAADNNRAVGRLEQALSDYQKLQSTFDQSFNDDYNAQINHGLGQVYFKKKEYNQALELFKRNFSLNPAEEKWLVPDAYFQAGRCMLRLGNKEKAEQYFDKIDDFDYDYDFKNAMDSRIKNELTKF